MAGIIPQGVNRRPRTRSRGGPHSAALRQFDARWRWGDLVRESDARAKRGARLVRGSLADEEKDDLLGRIQLIRKQLAVAVSEEDYKNAASLRDQMKTLTEELSPLLRLTVDSVQKLGGKDEEERLRAIRILGEVGDLRVVPDLARELHGGPACMEAAADAMWAIFMRVKSPGCQEPFYEGCHLMNDSKTWPAAEACFTRVIETDPAVMEAWNKRATLYYLQLRYQEAIHDCERVLSLCPYHFGALSGLGLIYRALNRPKDALHWCQRALQVHPGLDAIRVLADSCERQLNEP